MDDASYGDEWHMNYLQQFGILSQAAMFGQNLQNPPDVRRSNLQASLPAHTAFDSSHTNQLKTTSLPSCEPAQLSNPHTSSSLSVLSFQHPTYGNQIDTVKLENPMDTGSINSLPFGVFSQGLLEEENYAYQEYNAAKRVCAGNKSSQNQDHIIAERKRRERLSQRFIALSAIVPGLKKTDKASILGDTIKYLKQLQEKVKTLEEQTKKRTMETFVSVKKSQIFADGENSSSDGNFCSSPTEPLPEIETRFCEKNLLIRIHCEKRTGVLEKTISEIEKLQLTVVNSSSMTFGSSSLHVTIIAQMNADFCMSAIDFARKIRSTLESFI